MRAAGVAAANTVNNSAFTADGKKRYFDASVGEWIVKLLPGHFYVTQQDEMIATILGSCVAACIRDPLAGIGGMNHFMLPEGGATRSWNGESESARFGNYAMEKLVNELLKAGCSRASLEIKVFGGANVIQSSSQVGTGNSNFILEYLRAEGLPCTVHDLGGTFPRRIHYYPMTGRVIRRFLNNTSARDVVTEEKAYARTLSAKPTAGDIELFDE